MPAEWVGEVSSHIHGSSLTCGFSHNEFRTLRLKSFFSALLPSAEWGFYCPGEPKRDVLGGFPNYGILGPVLATWGHCDSFAVSLPLVLGPASVCASHPGPFGVTAPPIWSVQWWVHTSPSLLPCPLRLKSAEGCMWLLSLSFSLLVSLFSQICPPWDTSLHNASHVFVCWAGNSLLSYSCPTSCNLKRRDMEVPLCHHAANITPK